MEQGIVQIYTGEGKGKTTAALGLVLRAVGFGMRACVVQFMKNSPVYAEIVSLRDILGPERVELHQFGRKPRPGQDFAWVNPKRPAPEDREQVRAAFDLGREAVHSGRFDLVVMDEVNTAVLFGLLTEGEVIELMRGKPGGVELILTGRGATAAMMEAADLVSEMKMIKHPYDSGLKARRGIEY